MTEIEIIDKIGKEFMDTIYEHLPKEWIFSNGSSGPSFNAQLNKMNSAYEASDYFYNEERKFIHWTNVQNLMSIINNREIRLYNLHKSSDAKEFNFAAEQLSIPEHNVDYSKNYLYTFSFCEIKEKNNPKLWSEYGKDYSGVAIEFEIDNEPKRWNNYMLSQCYYSLPVRYSPILVQH